MIEMKGFYKSLKLRLMDFHCFEDGFLQKLYVDFSSTEFSSIVAKIGCADQDMWIFLKNDEFIEAMKNNPMTGVIEH